MFCLQLGTKHNNMEISSTQCILENSKQQLADHIAVLLGMIQGQLRSWSYVASNHPFGDGGHKGWGAVIYIVFANGYGRCTPYSVFVSGAWGFIMKHLSGYSG